MGINKFALIGIRAATDQLSTDELVALFMAASYGQDPREVMGYEKAKSLFTEFNGTKMLADTLAALDSIVGERLAKQEG